VTSGQQDVLTWMWLPPGPIVREACSNHCSNAP